MGRYGSLSQVQVRPVVDRGFGLGVEVGGRLPGGEHRIAHRSRDERVVEEARPRGVEHERFCVERLGNELVELGGNVGPKRHVIGDQDPVRLQPIARRLERLTRVHVVVEPQ